jgi:hypothetical protein
MQGTRVASQGVLPTVADRNMVIAGVADFTGDTRPDILWHNNKTGMNSFWRLKGVSILKSSIPTFATPARSEIAAIGDLNHDGKADILWRDTKTGTATAWYMNRTARASTAVLSALASIRGYEVMIGRITADDGNILCRRISTGATRIWSLSGITPVSASILS